MDTLRVLISRYTLWIKLTYLLFIGGGLYFALSGYVYDDPFITYRYADNLRSGIGFVYNPGERILSTTTPLFAILLAFTGNFWSNLPHLANFIGAFSIAAGGLLIWELGQTWDSPFVGWSGLLLFPTFPLLLITLGSETPLFLALALGSFLLYARRRYGGAVVLIALAILTRSDGILIAALLGIHYLWSNRSRIRQLDFWRNQPWGWIAIALGLLLAWHTVAWIYFGSPLPVTLAAKQAQGRMALSQGFALGILRIAGWYSGGWQYWVQLVLVGIGLVFAFIKQHRWLLIFSWTGLYFLAYSYLGVTSYFWYYAPLVPAWVVAVGLGISLIFCIPLPDQLRTSHFWNRILLVVVIFLLAALFFAQAINIQKMSQRTDPRYTIYSAVGDWLAQNTPKDASVGVLEVGMIGYFSQRSMVDFAGLIQPEVADQMQTATTYDDTALWAVQNYQPDYLALIVGAHPRLEAEVVSLYCQPMKHFAGPQYGFKADMGIFACQFDGD